MATEEKTVSNKSITLSAMNIIGEFRESLTKQSYRGFIDGKLFIVTPLFIDMLKDHQMSKAEFNDTGEVYVIPEDKDAKEWRIFKLKETQGGKWNVADLRMDLELKQITKEMSAFEI